MFFVLLSLDNSLKEEQIRSLKSIDKKYFKQSISIEFLNLNKKGISSSSMWTSFKLALLFVLLGHSDIIIILFESNRITIRSEPERVWLRVEAPEVWTRRRRRPRINLRTGCRRTSTRNWRRGRLETGWFDLSHFGSIDWLWFSSADFSLTHKLSLLAGF
jgi:hypothetical protein